MAVDDSKNVQQQQAITEFAVQCVHCGQGIMLRCREGIQILDFEITLLSVKTLWETWNQGTRIKEGKLESKIRNPKPKRHVGTGGLASKSERPKLPRGAQGT